MDCALDSLHHLFRDVARGNQTLELRRGIADARLTQASSSSMKIVFENRPLPSPGDAPKRIEYTTCYMCACRCGINVHLRDGKVAAVEAVNAGQDYMIGRRLIAEGKAVDAARLADLSIPAKNLAS